MKRFFLFLFVFMVTLVSFSLAHTITPIDKQGCGNVTEEESAQMLTVTSKEKSGKLIVKYKNVSNYRLYVTACLEDKNLSSGALCGAFGLRPGKTNVMTSLGEYTGQEVHNVILSQYPIQDWVCHGRYGLSGSALKKKSFKKSTN